MSTDTLSQAGHDILSVLPQRHHDVARLQHLNSGDDTPVVTVVGKYNHGKSRLLNELIGHNAFSVADKRETVALANVLHNGVRWLDAPGLDADVNTDDDRVASQAIWLLSDIRLFVHAAKEGELDANERALLHQLHADDQHTRRQTLLVLSQADQLADDASLEKIGQTIMTQAPAMPCHVVSSTRHQKGTQEGKALLVGKSGIPVLKSRISDMLDQVPHARNHERNGLVESIHAELEQRQEQQAATLATLQQQHKQDRRNFDRDLDDALSHVAANMKDVLNVPGTDHSLIPDSNQDRFTLTAGKRERARLQIAYSKACIYLNGILTRHGVFELPTQQRTAAASLNTVMVAVMGVSVKYRNDLDRMFCTGAGQQTLQRQFGHYFELSPDRQALFTQITHTETELAATHQALVALDKLAAFTPA